MIKKILRIRKLNIKINKNKFLPFNRIKVRLNNEGDLLDLALKANIVEKTGSWFSYEEQKIGQGREKVKLLLSEDLKMRKVEKSFMQMFMRVITGKMKSLIVFQNF